MTKPKADTLPSEYTKIMDNAKHGVIIMSFGSIGLDIKSQEFITAFRNLKQVVIWRAKEKSNNLPPNVHQFDWLPQSDLLAHPNVKLFITHSGRNGQLESIYNAVPMLQVPMFADQPHNAVRGQYHGFGLTLDILTITSSEIEQTINELMSNPVYKQKVTKAVA